MSCTACEIRPEGGFRSPGEDIELEATLQDHPVLRSMPVPDGWISYGLEEHFYRCVKCGQEWHHAYPDGPYKGVWGKL